MRSSLAEWVAPLGAGLSLSTRVIGVGIFILPGLLSVNAPVYVFAGWISHLVLGFLIATTFGLVSIRAASPRTLADIAEDSLGKRWRTAVDVWYLIGFTVGQAAVALGAAYYAGAALGRAPREGTFLALVVALVASALAAKGLRIRGRGRYAVVAFIVTLFISGKCFGAVHRISPIDQDLGSIDEATFLFTFAFIGWEEAFHLRARIAPKKSAVVLSATTSTVFVGLFYWWVAVAFAPRGSEEAVSVPSALMVLPTEGLGSVLLMLAAAVSALLCANNIGATGEVATRLCAAETLSPRLLQASSLLVGAAVLIVLRTATAFHVSLATLLLVPNAMAVAIYGVALVAAFKALPRPERGLAVVALLGVGGLARFAGPALLAPASGLLLALALAKIRHSPSRRS